jgi:hypothetical protein
MNMESLFEYGARAGFWRLWRLFAPRPLARAGVSTLADEWTVAVAKRARQVLRASGPSRMIGDCQARPHWDFAGTNRARSRPAHTIPPRSVPWPCRSNGADALPRPGYRRGPAAPKCQLNGRPCARTDLCKKARMLQVSPLATRWGQWTAYDGAPHETRRFEPIPCGRRPDRGNRKVGRSRMSRERGQGFRDWVYGAHLNQSGPRPLYLIAS